MISRFTVLHSVGDTVRDHHGAEFCTPVSELHQSYTHTFDFVALLPEHNFFTRLSFTFGICWWKETTCLRILCAMVFGVVEFGDVGSWLPQQQPYLFHCRNRVLNARRHFICKSIGAFWQPHRSTKQLVRRHEPRQSTNRNSIKLQQ